MSEPPDALAEYRAAVMKIDAAVAALTARASDAITCHKGCASCCVEGLSVLSVEAAAIRASGLAPPARPAEGMCAFLDVDGLCSIYASRPLLCRTHGLPLKMGEARPGLRVMDDVSVCALNFTTRVPEPAETLDATAVMMLLTTVDARYATRAGLDTARQRQSLRAIAAELSSRA